MSWWYKNDLGEHYDPDAITMLSTQDLDHFVAHDSVLYDVYQGTFPKDWFLDHVFHDTNPRFPKAYIFNTDDSQSPGKHWISVYRPVQGTIELFDSYGRHPHHWGKELVHMLHTTGWFNQHLNHLPRQYPYSTLCGVYCLYMLCQRVRGQTFEDIVNLWDPQYPLQNDINLIHWYERHAPTDSNGCDILSWTPYQYVQPYCPLYKH